MKVHHDCGPLPYTDQTRVACPAGQICHVAISLHHHLGHKASFWGAAFLPCAVHTNVKCRSLQGFCMV